MNSGSQHYMFASNRAWNIEAFQKVRPELPGLWAVINHSKDLINMAKMLKPRYTFFPHWSDIVPSNVLSQTECVCFHMTDLPFGRGGSPLQNLISRGHTETVISAIQMVPEIDAGPVYMKRALSLQGTAHEIYINAAEIVMDMISEIVTTEPKPTPQTRPPTLFKRRTPSQSVMPESTEAEALYDHIRMLDAPDYPHGFLDHGPWRLYFTNAHLEGRGLQAKVRFQLRGNNK